jgi:thiol-disulfide isomerase/thioredoxin
MIEYIQPALIAAITFLVVIVVYRLVAGYYPGSKFIVQESPAPKNGLDSDQAKFMFFYTAWCPWSDKAQAPWASYKQMIKNQKATFGGKHIIFEEIDADIDKGKAALYQIKQYPTFLLETQDKVYTLLAIPHSASFEAFLTGILGQKVPH